MHSLTSIHFDVFSTSLYSHVSVFTCVCMSAIMCVYMCLPVVNRFYASGGDSFEEYVKTNIEALVRKKDKDPITVEFAM